MADLHAGALWQQEPGRVLRREPVPHQPEVIKESGAFGDVADAVDQGVDSDDGHAG